MISKVVETVSGWILRKAVTKLADDMKQSDEGTKKGDEANLKYFQEQNDINHRLFGFDGEGPLAIGGPDGSGKSSDEGEKSSSSPSGSGRKRSTSTSTK